MNKHLSLAVLFALSLGVAGCSSLPSWMGGHPKEKEKLVGERIAVLPLSADLQPDAALKMSPPSLPPAAANADWPQHSGAVPAENANLAGGSFDESSRASAGGGASFEHTLIPRPVVAGGIVFTMDAVGAISARNASNIGETGWQSKGVSEEDEPQIMGGGLAWDQGTLYATSGRGTVAAFEAATGKTLWTKSLRIPFRSAPKVADGKLFATTIDNQIYAFSAASGELLWNQRGISETAGLMSSVSPAVAGEMVIVPFSSGEIYALAQTDGRQLWSDSIGAVARTQATASFSGIGGDPVVDGSVVFAVSSGDMISALSLEKGQHVWDRPIGAFNTPWVAGDTLFLLSSDNTLAAFEKFTGKIRWATKLAGFEDMEEKKDPITWKGPVLVDNKLAVVGSNGQLLLVSARDGTIEATKPIPEGVYTAPVVAGGRMYLIAQDATLVELH